MLVHRVGCIFFLIFTTLTSYREKSTPPPPSNNQQSECVGFTGWVKTSRWGGSYEAHGGCLTLQKDSIHIQDPPVDFQINDLASLHQKKFLGISGFLFKLKNGHKVEFYPVPDKAAVIRTEVTYLPGL